MSLSVKYIDIFIDKINKFEDRLNNNPNIGLQLASSESNKLNGFTSTTFFQKYKNNLKAKKRGIKTLKNRKRRMKNVWFAILGIVTQHKMGMLEDKDIPIQSRNIGTLLFEIKPFKFSGYESIESIKRREANKKYRATYEHFYPRQFAGLVILTHIKLFGELTLEQFEQYCDVFTQVHKVTREENKLLERYQKTEKFISPDETYRLANIILQKVKDALPVLKIEDVAPQELIEELGLKPSKLVA